MYVNHGYYICAVKPPCSGSVNLSFPVQQSWGLFVPGLDVLQVLLWWELLAKWPNFYFPLDEILGQQKKTSSWKVELP